jgi:hypothetical protein
VGGEDDGDADHEEEGGEDHVGECRALPCGVEEGREDGGICAWVGDENHGGDRESAHDVQGEETGVSAGGRCGGCGARERELLMHGGRHGLLRDGIRVWSDYAYAQRFAQRKYGDFQFFIRVHPSTLAGKVPPGAGGKNALPDRYFVIVAPPDDGRRGLCLRGVDAAYALEPQ